MTFDYYAALHDENHVFSEEGRVWNLASGFVDRAVTDRAEENAEDARRYYQNNTSRVTLALPQLDLDAGGSPARPGWFSLCVLFELQTPWYSKDDRPFHVLDNPLRKDRVFGIPFMSATNWKGLLRWACRMEAGLLTYLEKHGNNLNGWPEPEWIVHLFGNERDADKHFSRGALAFRPTWFDKVGFEVINPHDRTRRAGTQPIIYEVVPPKTRGSLRLLYAPLPGCHAPDSTFECLLAAIEKLLTVYGFSAKRTAGWGITTANEWLVSGVGGTIDKLRNAQAAVAQLDAVRSAGGKP